MHSSSASSVRTPSTIADKYQIVRLIKSGGMGEVYEARHLRLGRRVAIKFLRAAYAQDPAHTARFDREACAAGSLEHENIIALFDIGCDERGVPFIVMEYVQGDTLRTLIDESAPLPVPRAVAIALQICAGLQAAHARGIIHRDLKPDNLMVSERSDGRDWVKILDFGIARVIHDTAQPDVTATGVVLGTAHYMSPEQARGETIDARSDVHAVAAILYELLSGEKVHPGDTYNTAIYHVLRKEFVPLETLRPTLPHDLVEAVHRALAAQADQRFASVEAFAASLSPFVKTERSTGDGETHTGTRRVSPVTTRETRSKERNRWVLSASIAALVVVLGYLSLRFTGTPDTRETAPPAIPAAIAERPTLAPASPPVPLSASAVSPEVADAPAMSIPSSPPVPSVTPVKPSHRPAASAGKRSPTSPDPTPTKTPAVPEGFVDNPYGR
jgi:serine/threonine-protein kinase